jgi:hypothetical protein
MLRNGENVSFLRENFFVLVGRAFPLVLFPEERQQ